MANATLHNFNKYKASQLVEDGKYQISVGDLDLALETFRKSVELDASAEGLTYVAWLLNLKGHVDEAIDLCKQAIKLDPEFGNSLNDLGSYYMKKNQLEEAIPWLQKAKAAKTYDLPHFPFINLGRVYSSL